MSSDDTITASKITTYLMCPRKFAFRYVERLPVPFKAAALAFGSSVHGALRLFHEKRIEGETLPTDEVVQRFVVDWLSEVAGELHFKEDETASSLREQGENLVRMYVAQNATIPVRAAEAPFQVPLIDPETGEVIGPDLKGVFDLILDDDTVVEIKTAARAYDSGTLARHLQLSAYAYAYRTHVGRDPTVKVVALLKTKKPRVDCYEARRTPTDDAWFVHLAVEVHCGIEAGVFPPNPGWPCGDCEYAEPCRTWRGRRMFMTPAQDAVHLPVYRDEAAQ